MYYEEKRIDGVWYCRTTPNGEWVKRDVLNEDRTFALHRNKIRGVAILCHTTGLVVSLNKPARHHHVIHKMVEMGWHTPIGHTGYMQGFIDDRGYFLDREQAAQYIGYGVKKLFSEDLW